MIEWWNSMDLAGQIFALIAIPSTLVLVIQTVLLLFGMGDDDVETDGIDLNGNGVGDTPGDGGGDEWRCFPSEESWLWLLSEDGADLQCTTTDFRLP